MPQTRASGSTAHQALGESSCPAPMQDRHGNASRRALGRSSTKAKRDDIVILGIDPGLANTGWGVIVQQGSMCRPLAYGCIATAAGEDLAVRLKDIHDQMAAVVKRYRPAEVGIESIYFGVNSQSAFATGQARGAALVATAEASLFTGEYTPMQIKQSVVGTGAADKYQVQYMVRAMLKLSQEIKPDHASDALAAAICHAHMRRGRMLEECVDSEWNGGTQTAAQQRRTL
jgi:crossover junction endodeoxyribonuclease RuvC